MQEWSTCEGENVFVLFYGVHVTRAKCALPPATCAFAHDAPTPFWFDSFQAYAASSLKNTR